MKRTSITVVALALVAAACGDTDVAVAEPPATTAPSTTTTTIPSFHPEGKGWELVWSDEFDGTELDLERWDHEENCWGGGNNELQCYTASDTNVAVADGLLRITALEEEATGLAVSEDFPEAATAGNKTQPYTSGRIRTKGLGDWRYGRFEIRARLPYGQGLWPAVWMLPTDSPYGSWAAGGEIDIMEAVNLKTRDGAVTRSVHGTLHYGAEWPANVFSGTFWPFGDDHPSDVFHTYALEWEEGEIRWYVDGTHYATQTADGWYTQFAGPDGALVVGEGAAPFDQPFHLILNVAVGGTWPGPPDDKTVFPQEMLVDYVRVYRCAESPEDGKGCATVSDAAALVGGG